MEQVNNDITREEALRLYRLMCEVRAFELAAVAGYKEGDLPGFIHVSLGQEACSAGACAALEKNDLIASTHRGHGHCLVKGADPGRMFAELYAKHEGYSKGRGGSMHIADVEKGVLGANGIVGQSIGLGVGAALSLQTRGKPNCVVAFFGEGASGSGIAHEAMNMAAIWKLPIIFFCESNRYAELSPYRTHVSVPNVADRAAAYGFPGSIVDGEDVVAVFSEVRAAAERARKGGGPSLIEAKTFRWHGHYEGDPQRYKSEDERTRGNEFDAIARLRERAGRWAIDVAELERIEAEANRYIDEQLAWAKNLQSPPHSVIVEDVYSGDYHG